MIDGLQNQTIDTLNSVSSFNCNDKLDATFLTEEVKDEGVLSFSGSKRQRKINNWIYESNSENRDPNLASTKTHNNNPDSSKAANTDTVMI